MTTALVEQAVVNSAEAAIGSGTSDLGTST
jgi:hypothetical protein